MGAGPQYQSVKEALGREWMRTTLKNSGFDTANPSLFSSDKFLKAIDDLGETGEELFGGQLAGIRSVANSQMDDLSIGRINQNVLDDAFEAGVDQSVLTGMRNALGAARGFAEVRKPQLLRKLNDGTLEADEALSRIFSPRRKKEVRAIMNFFERSGNEQAMASIRGAVLDDIFDGMGATVNAQDLANACGRIAKREKVKTARHSPWQRNRSRCLENLAVLWES